MDGSRWGWRLERGGERGRCGERGLRWEELVGDTLGGGGWKTCSLFYFDAKFGAWLRGGESVCRDDLLSSPLRQTRAAKAKGGDPINDDRIPAAFSPVARVDNVSHVARNKVPVCPLASPDKVGMMCP